MIHVFRGPTCLALLLPCATRERNTGASRSADPSQRVSRQGSVRGQCADAGKLAACKRKPRGGNSAIPYWGPAEAARPASSSGAHLLMVLIRARGVRPALVHQRE